MSITEVVPSIYSLVLLITEEYNSLFKNQKDSFEISLARERKTADEKLTKIRRTVEATKHKFMIQSKELENMK